MDHNKALILGGGSIKGGWQVGAIKACLEYGFMPNIIGGISVGSLNGTWIANEVGKQKVENSADIVKWDKVAEGLVDFWLNNIKKPEDIAIKRKIIPLLWSILRKKFNGVSNTKPLQKLIYGTVKQDFLTSSGIDLYVGAVNVAGGEITYARPELLYFLEYVLASSAIPFMMPVSKIGKQPYLDGGLRDSAPLGVAIHKGAEEIICIGCHPERTGSAEINTGNAIELAERIMEIISNNNLNNDIKKAQLYNNLLASGYSGKEVHGKKLIKLTIIRPDGPIGVKINSFCTDDIKEMILSGYQTAKRILTESA